MLDIFQTASYKSIAVDGNDADWADVPELHADPAGDGVPDIASVKIANDTDFIYLLVRYSAPVDTNTSNGSPGTFLSLDNDANPATGFDIHGLGLIGAEVSWQNDHSFAQDPGNYNLGATFSGAAAIAPFHSNTAFQEYRIRRDTTYTIGGNAARPVFPNNNMRFAFWSDHGTAAEFAGAVEYTIAAPPPVPSHFSHIRVDGDFSDWASVPALAADTVSDGTPDIVSIKAANDDGYLYVLVGYNGPVQVNNASGAPSTFLSLDNDANSATGFNIYGLGLIGAEVSWQNDYPFAQSAGNYNTGASFTAGAAAISPYSTRTAWQEYRIRRDATYASGGPATAVFPNDTIRLAMWTDGSPAEFAGGAAYTFATNPGATDYAKWRHANFTAAGLADPLTSGDTADPDHDGMANLMEFALGGLPESADAPVLPDIPATTVGTGRHLAFTYKRPVAPSAITVTPETSADLLSWDGSPSQFVTISTGPPSGGREEVVVRLADTLSAAPRFVRLKAVYAP